VFVCRGLWLGDLRIVLGRLGHIVVVGRRVFTCAGDVFRICNHFDLLSLLWTKEMEKQRTGAPLRAHLLPTLMITVTGTKRAVVNIFSNPQHAQFLAAAVSASSIPKLHGVPEVSGGGTVFCVSRLLIMCVGHCDWTRERW